MKTEDAAKRWLEALGPAGERASFRLLAPIIESPRPVVVTMTLGLIPLAGAVTNAITAFVTTEYLGHYVDRALDNPDKPPPALSIQDILDSITSLFTTRAR
ncbi:hypothetical protein WME95_18250 [Sorangium sp. So ce327]|uniref:hypothetical protein n=1 Tax=Sorangium sp. So ce327 TaxID=3133301 RepID=UPI003F637B55